MYSGIWSETVCALAESAFGTDRGRKVKGMKKNGVFMRMLALGTALAMLCTACGDSAKAGTMRLMRIKGSVGLCNGEGQRMSPQEEMLLYSGYQLSTQRRSFAWINLDDVKLSKMDASSEIEIRKNGKELEIVVNQGKLYFNITKPLEEDENLSIRTSTMSVGIRGTCGWVEVDAEETVRAYILEGTVECRTAGSGAGLGESVAVQAGKVASFSPGEINISVEPFEEKDVRPFVLEELADDKALQERIREDSGLDIRDFTDDNSPDDPAAQAFDELQRALQDGEDGSLRDRVSDALRDGELSGREGMAAGAGDTLADYQRALVEEMLKNGQAEGGPGWLQSLKEAFSPENLEGSLADGSEATDYMQIRMGRRVNCYKPNIYLYGEAGTAMELVFSAPMLLTRTIPDYSGSWTVELTGDGSVTVDGEGEYPYLFYESITIPGIFQTQEGFFVEASNRGSRFEEILSAYGLNRQEIDDFVEFWNGFLEEGIDYVMYPQTTETVDGAMPLEIYGAEPDHYFRLWFCFIQAQESMPLPAEPQIAPASHEGTALVEWGGMVF